MIDPDDEACSLGRHDRAPHGPTFEYLMRRNAEGWCLRLGIAEAHVSFDLQHGWRRHCILQDHAPTVPPLDHVAVETWEGK